jgi:hypothetical protein
MSHPNELAFPNVGTTPTRGLDPDKDFVTARTETMDADSIRISR